MEWKHDELPYRLSDVPMEMQPEAVHRMLQGSYWAAERPLETVKRSLAASFAVGLFAGDEVQVGLARAVTDGATFAWICDVIVDPAHRGRGLGTWMVRTLVGHPALQGLNLLLGTRDAHGLYERFGFVRREMMIRRFQPLAAD